MFFQLLILFMGFINNNRIDFFSYFSINDLWHIVHQSAKRGKTGKHNN
jgi:hypothetical protein